MTDPIPPADPGPDAPPRAPAFIVTIYGDVVEPRGGMLWMGTLIACCARHGLNESLVRTAVSRLVGAGRLEGVRIGRKSYFRLSAAARAEFRAAARLLFGPPPLPEDWMLCLSDTLRETEPPAPWVRLAPSVALAPNREDLTPLPGALLRARDLEGQGDLAVLAADRWPLAEVAAAYRGFLARHAALADRRATRALTPPEALALRLRLVHDYRLAALRDPRLPCAVLPPDWPAEAARLLFLRAYPDLSEAADRHVGDSFLNAEGPLPAQTALTRQRLFDLRRAAARPEDRPKASRHDKDTA